MLEYLMAGMWILLRDRGNRNILAKAFDIDDDQKSKEDAESRIAEAIRVHEATEEQMTRTECPEEFVDHVVPEDETDSEDKEEDEWGLLSLVKVGETWLETLLSGSGEHDANSSILKLFEFLTASLCLFVIPDDQIPPQGPKQIYELDTEKQDLVQVMRL